jgi:hypothetical protein
MNDRTITRRAALFASAGFAVSACASSGIATGAYKVGPEFSVTLGEKWADVSNWMLSRPRGLRLLTIDGPLLNRLYITEGIRPGGFIVRPESREDRTPTYRVGMSSREFTEFVVDSVASLGYIDPESENPRPAKFGGVDGVRTDLTARLENGLEIAGTALIAERRERLFLMLYLAPQEHYYAARLGEVEAVFASATLTP